MVEEQRGELTVYQGPMFSDKTSKLIQLYLELTEGVPEEEINAHCFKWAGDNRYVDEHEDPNKLVAHNGATAPAILFEDKENPKQLLKLVPKGMAHALIDEAMFLSNEIIEVVEALLAQGINVTIAGLDKTAEGEPFGPMPELVKKADEVYNLKASICDKHGRQCPNGGATRSYRKAPMKTTQTVGGKDAYGACCVQSWGELHVPLEE